MPFFIRGYKRELLADDMYRHRTNHDSGTLGDKLEAAWNKERERKKEPSLLTAIIKVFYLEYLLLYALAIIIEGGK